MSSRKYQINGKTVLLSEPYHAPASAIVGRENDLRTVLSSWVRGRNARVFAPLLVGEPGTGKNKIIYESARKYRRDLYITLGNEDITAEDLFCSVRESDEPGRKVDYILSPLATAVLTGNVGFIDEIGKLRHRALAPLASLLDERRYLDSNLLGERITAHPGFRFVAATNLADLNGRSLPDFILSRLRPVVRIDYPPREEINQMIRCEFEQLRNSGAQLLDCFWRLWGEKHGDRPPSPREGLDIFGLAINRADFEVLEAQSSLHLDNPRVACGLTEDHLAAAFKVFHTDLARSS